MRRACPARTEQSSGAGHAELSPGDERSLVAADRYSLEIGRHVVLRIEERPSVLTVRVSRDGAVLHQQVHAPQYDSAYPIGKECGATAIANIDLAIP
jgi:hypothetical protein